MHSGVILIKAHPDVFMKGKTRLLFARRQERQIKFKTRETVLF